jgi:hypothetical protein
VLRLRAHERLLHAILGVEDDRQVRVAVMMVRKHGEDLADTPRRLAPGDLLRRFRQRQTNRAHALDLVHGAE